MGEFPFPARALQIPAFRIEVADECDGCRCNQPLFAPDGKLHSVVPHYHLVEWNAEGLHYHAIFLRSEELVQIV